LINNKSRRPNDLLLALKSQVQLRLRKISLLQQLNLPFRHQSKQQQHHHNQQQLPSHPLRLLSLIQSARCHNLNALPTQPLTPRRKPPHPLRNESKINITLIQI
jgi:hypothetical protein